MDKWFKDIIKIYYNQSDEVLKSIESGDLSKIYQTYMLLFEKNKIFKKKIVKALSIFIDSNNDLFKTAQMIRKIMNHEFYYYKWPNISPKELVDDKNLSEEEKINILGLSTFHPNGYYRERALRLLFDYHTGQELKFIIICLNDWVKEIYSIAYDFLISYLNQENVEVIYENIYYILRLQNFKRYDHQLIIENLKKLFSNEKNSDYISIGVQNKNRLVRKFFYKLFLESSNLNKNIFINYLIKEKDPSLRYIVTIDFLNRLNEEEVISFSPFFLKDKYNKIRTFIIYKLSLIDIVKMKDNIYPFLFDDSPYVREYVQYLLKQVYPYDFQNIYRAGLEKKEYLYSCISSLGDIGNIEDVNLINVYLKNNNIKIVKACLIAIQKLDFTNNKNLFLEYLKDARIGVSKCAYNQIKEHIRDFLDTQIYLIYNNTTYHHVRKYSAMLLFSFYKWKSLKYILEFLSEKDEFILKLAKYNLNKWIFNFNKDFIEAKLNELEKIKVQFKKNVKLLSDEQKEYFQFLLKI